MKPCRNFSQQTTRSTPLDPNLMFRGLSYYFCAFGTVCWLQHSVQNGPNWCKSSCHEVASEFFVAIAPVPPHWTLNSCFGVFCTIWMHLERLVALQNSMQKFVPWSHVIIFRNKRTRSTLLDRYLMFRCVSYYSGAFGTVCCVTALSSKQAKLVQKFVPRIRFGIFHS